MKILIYDDCLDDVLHLKQLLNEFSQTHEINFEITECPNSDYMLKNIELFDILFLDIEINNENGIKLGLKLNKLIHDCRIVITSSYKKYLIEGYKINADRYFLKPISSFEFKVDIEEIINQHFFKYNGFYDETISKHKILFKDILYIDSYDRKTRIHFINGKTISTYHLMKDWIYILDEKFFFMIHRSFIVNLNHISGYSKSDVFMNNGEALPISRNYKQLFEEKYLMILSRLY